jgi:hypothetical protein
MSTNPVYSKGAGCEAGGNCKVDCLKRTMEPGVGRQAIVNESHFHGFLL